MNGKKLIAYQGLLNLAQERGYQIKGQYINSREKIEIICPENHCFLMQPNNFKQGQSCPICAGRSPAKAKENFLTLAKERGYQIIGQYVNSSTPVDMICDNGHQISVRPSNLKKGSLCRKCQGLCKDQAKEEFDRLANDIGYQIISGYVNAHTKTKLICPNGHSFEIAPTNFKRGHGCAICAHVSFDDSKNSFLEKAKELNYTVIGKYIKNNISIEVICNNGHQVSVRPDHFKAGHHCKKCSGMCPEQAEDELKDLAKSRGYQIVGSYTNSHNKIDMICPNGHSFIISPTHFKSGQECNICQESSGEQIVRRSLEEIGVKISSQVILDELPRKRYDFMFEKGSKRFFIECDGGQHFKLIPLYHKDEEDFNERRKTDIIKTKVIVERGNTIIRLDDDWIKRNGSSGVIRLINDTIRSDESLVVSNRELYKWLF